MAPFPEDVDVFSVPHSRMKNLVKEYSEKLGNIDFKDNGALASLLNILYPTFVEFKCHEQIENQFIMKKLKTKLEDLSINDAAVCNCHSNNQLAEMFKLLKYGYTCESDGERLDFGQRLQIALQEFTEDFLPHMKEEEEVFQPLLVKYFEYEELRSMKELVIQEHNKSQFQANDAPPPEPVLDKLHINGIPPEIRSHIFSHLSPRDLITASQVCRLWRSEAFDLSHWNIFSPLAWDASQWEFPFPLEKTPLTYFDSSCENQEQLEKELENFATYFIPKIGLGIQKISLSGLSVSNEMLRAILPNCPNLLHLDLSYTNLNDSSFKGLQVGAKLKHLDLTGCSDFGDFGMLRLHLYLNKEPTLNHLSLSGCCKITDTGLGYLMKSLTNLEHLDVSGCWELSGKNLKKLCDQCGSLHPKDVYYCDFIEGPYRDTANGCQNLNTKFCCCNSE